MDDTPALTPELIALVDAGDGFAEVVDPQTKRVFVISEQRQPHPCAHPESEEELRAMLDEARADIAAGRVSTRSTGEFLAQLEERHGSSS